MTTPAPPALGGRFFRLWASSTSAGITTWALPFVLGLGVANQSWSAAVLGVLLGARTLGFIIGVPFGGVLADRGDRCTVVRVAGILAAVSTAVLGLSLPDAGWIGVIAALFVGVGQGAGRPAYQAMVQDEVHPDARQRANAAMTISVRVAVLVGPAAAALASQVISDVVLVHLSGLLWLLAAVLPASTKKTVSVEAVPAVVPAAGSETSGQAESEEKKATATPEPASRRTGSPLAIFGHDIKEGAEEALRHRWFTCGLGALSVVIMLGYSSTNVALPLISRDRFDGSTVLAAGVTAYTAGALVGALLIARWKPRNAGWWAMGSLAAYSLVPLSLALSPSPLLIVASYVVAGFCIEIFNVPWFTAVQREVPPGKVARVSSLDFLVSYGLSPLGLAALAPAIEHWGSQPVLLFCAAACLIAPVAVMLEPSSREFSSPKVKQPVG
ncbi:MFS transporter [Austwickia chelonae]|uniref:Putative major facilitator superfamily transporter n=1 Tax=Austwickia chelonae NBRC 105200 TaxID=1184607 RepID=K6V8I4_9MICO|nr:MFS transporter [Austwickia chelonae]GAB78503.1 putative major facilitator superfamily transporter [Austwickia chelonae NBRC 105200]